MPGKQPEMGGSGARVRIMVAENRNLPALKQLSQQKRNASQPNKQEQDSTHNLPAGAVRG
jgi:hypothetical protein